jgi:hypothetical protein
VRRDSIINLFMLVTVLSILKHGGWNIFAVLNSVEIQRNRIFLGGQVFIGPRMSENAPSSALPIETWSEFQRD